LTATLKSKEGNPNKRINELKKGREGEGHLKGEET